MPKYVLNVDKTMKVLAEYDDYHFKKYCLNGSCNTCKQNLTCDFFKNFSIQLALLKKNEKI